MIAYTGYNFHIGYTKLINLPRSYILGISGGLNFSNDSYGDGKRFVKSSSGEIDSFVKSNYVTIVNITSGAFVGLSLIKPLNKKNFEPTYHLVNRFFIKLFTCLKPNETKICHPIYD